MFSIFIRVINSQNATCGTDRWDVRFSRQSIYFAISKKFLQWSTTYENMFDLELDILYNRPTCYLFLNIFLYPSFPW